MALNIIIIIEQTNMDAEVTEREVYEFGDYDDPPLGYREPRWSHLV